MDGLSFFKGQQPDLRGLYDPPEVEEAQAIMAGYSVRLIILVTVLST